MKTVSVKAFDRLCCELMDRGWTTRYESGRRAYVIVTQDGEIWARDA